MIDHNLGGGANLYRDGQVRRRRDSGIPVLTLYYNLPTMTYYLQYADREAERTFALDSLDALVYLVESVEIDEIVLNNAVSFDDPLMLATLLPYLKRVTGAKFTVALHDYFAICPSWTLLDDQGHFCRVPNIVRCRECLPNVSGNSSLFTDCKDIDRWRSTWGRCLQEATTILCFSRSSIELLHRAYPSLDPDKVELQPHGVEEFSKSEFRPDFATELHIGIVGDISAPKGADIVREIAGLIIQRSLPIKITVIGTVDRVSESRVLRITGPYKRQDLPRIIEMAGANVFFLPSICPETFSYVTAELIQLGLPLVVFNIGAQGEKVAKYGHGLVVDEVSAPAALEKLIAFHRQLQTESTRSVSSQAEG
jgi:glycosyltransferase involved in cell wall biosynthesis